MRARIMTKHWGNCWPRSRIAAHASFMMSCQSRMSGMPLYRRWVRKHRAPTSADAGHCENRRRSTSVRRAINRANIMIKVVATSEGVAAVEALIGEGINVNITLMFSLRHYEAVANAYLRGLERCREPAKVASVASFFVSRVDTDADRALEAIGTTERKSVVEGKR